MISSEAPFREPQAIGGETPGKKLPIVSAVERMGERKGVKGKFYRQERPTGFFQRVVNIQAAISRDRVTAKMKDGVILINTARGAVLCESDVVDALNSGKLYAVGADVFAMEPPGRDHALASHPRCIATPHVAWMPNQTRQRIIDISGENLRCFLSGNPQNVVKPK